MKQKGENAYYIMAGPLFPRWGGYAECLSRCLLSFAKHIACASQFCCCYAFDARRPEGHRRRHGGGAHGEWPFRVHVGQLRRVACRPRDDRGALRNALMSTNDPLTSRNDSLMSGNGPSMASL